MVTKIAIGEVEHDREFFSAAAELGRKGGKTRAANMTPEPAPESPKKRRLSDGRSLRDSPARLRRNLEGVAQLGVKLVELHSEDKSLRVSPAMADFGSRLHNEFCWQIRYISQHTC